MARRRRRSARSIRIEGWDLDEANVEELATHGLHAGIVDELAEGQPRFRRNKKRRAATHQMIGPDQGGRIWVETEPSIWRPITGWQARDAEIEWWRRNQ